MGILPADAGARSTPTPWDRRAEDAVARLRATGMPIRTRDGRGAHDSVAAAMAAGWTSDEILSAVRGWFAYADSPQGSTIEHRGFFTGAKLRGLEAPPKVEKSREQIARDAIAERYRQLVGRG